MASDVKTPGLYGTYSFKSWNRRWRIDMRRSDIGFTLIELLVVIAIIAILAAILFPVFVRAKDAAKLSMCLSNLSQLGKARQMYSDDYNGRLPLNFSWFGMQNNNNHCEAYYMLLTKYTKKQSGAFLCPKTNTRPRIDPETNKIAWGPGNYCCNATALWACGRVGIDPFKQYGYSWNPSDQYRVTSYAALVYPFNGWSTDPNAWKCWMVAERFPQSSKGVYLFEAKYDFFISETQVTLRAEEHDNDGVCYVCPRHKDWQGVACLFYDVPVKTLDWNYFKTHAFELTGYYLSK
jgi:prepilin-type N-terminal cleavage/methylation domain-containing protein